MHLLGFRDMGHVAMRVSCRSRKYKTKQNKTLGAAPICPPMGAPIRPLGWPAGLALLGVFVKFSGALLTREV